MPSGHDVVATAVAILNTPGIHYDQCGSRCFPENQPHCVDCSGLTSAVLRRLGLGEHGCEGSFAQMRRVYAAGTQLDIATAFRTPGAVLAEGVNNGRGGIPGVDPGHIGISVGDGVHTLEARGHWAGVGTFAAGSLRWSGAGVLPGISAGAPPPVPVPLPPLAVQEDPMTMIVLPRKPNTPVGRDATARPVKAFNFVLLEDGARLEGDQAVAGNGDRHWWAPHAGQVPGWQLIDIADLRPATGEKALAVRYGYPNGDSGTYRANIV